MRNFILKNAFVFNPEIFSSRAKISDKDCQPLMNNVAMIYNSSMNLEA